MDDTVLLVEVGIEVDNVGFVLE